MNQYPRYFGNPAVGQLGYTVSIAATCQRVWYWLRGPEFSAKDVDSHRDPPGRALALPETNLRMRVDFLPGDAFAPGAGKS